MRTGLAITLGALIGFALLTTPASASFAIQSPTLDPGFRGQSMDYVVDCPTRVPLTVRSDRHGVARIGAGRDFTGRRTKRVALDQGQAIKITRERGGRTSHYWVRCLPSDFPQYRYKRIRESHSGLFATTPYGFQTATNFAIIFNRFGAPIWWYQGSAPIIDAKVLSDGTIAFARFAPGGHATDPASRYDLRRPNGSLKRSLRTVGAITDNHDLQQTADGNFMLLSYHERAEPVDASEFNGDSSATVLDAVIQKLTPEGKLLWTWNSKDHIGLAETGRWWPELDEPYDLVHINAIEPTNSGNDYLISLRHTDAVYRLDGVTGDVEWKLGGEQEPESLQVRNDPSGDYPFGGQHDVRQLADGTITVHDNATRLSHATRAVRYRIRSGVARLVDAQEDPLAPQSGCCGSARWLGDSWLMSWGGTDLITEIDGDGKRTFKLRMPDAFSYRANPVDGAVSASTLRRGMNRQVSPAK